MEWPFVQDVLGFGMIVVVVSVILGIAQLIISWFDYRDARNSGRTGGPEEDISGVERVPEER